MLFSVVDICLRNLLRRRWRDILGKMKFYLRWNVFLCIWCGVLYGTKHPASTTCCQKLRTWILSCEISMRLLFGSFAYWDMSVWLVCASVRIRQNEDTCLTETGLCLQVLVTTPHLVVNTIVSTYVFITSVNKHALPVNITTSGEVQSSIQISLMLCSRFANAEGCLK